MIEKMSPLHSPLVEDVFQMTPKNPVIILRSSHAACVKLRQNIHEKTRLHPRDQYPHLPSLGTLFVDVLQVDLDHVGMVGGNY